MQPWPAIVMKVRSRTGCASFSAADGWQWGLSSSCEGLCAALRSDFGHQSWVWGDHALAGRPEETPSQEWQALADKEAPKSNTASCDYIYMCDSLALFLRAVTHPERHSLA